MNGNIKVKKVSPYPIDITLGGDSGKIVKLTRTGFLVETDKPFKVGDALSSSFVLPVLNKLIPFKGVVVKTYDMFRDKSGAEDKNYKLAELLFKSIDPKGAEAISTFLGRIGGG